MSLNLFVCPDCGEQPRMWFDASRLDERAFEGVWFEIVPSVGPDGWRVQGQEKDSHYLDAFNMPRFLRQAVECVQNGEGIYCPNCQEPVEE